MSEPAADKLRSLIPEAEGQDPGDLSVRPIPGGASRETWLISTDAGGDPEAGRKWVLRRDPEGSVSQVAIGDEFELISRAAEAGVPVPEPLAFEPAGGLLETAAMLMAFVGGTSVAPRILRRDEFADARERLPAQLGAALAQIHSLGAADVGGAVGAAPEDPALAQLAEWERQLDEIGEPLPAVELGLRWLRRNAPEPAPARLVHGDFRLGNFIVDESGLAAVIDWELAHLGDPAEDVGWLCIRSWRFGSDERKVAGIGDLDGFLAAYEGADGERLDRDRIRYWEVFGNMKWAVICARQAHDHLTGVRRSHELASLGRRICEPEWDLVSLVEAS